MHVSLFYNIISDFYHLISSLYWIDVSTYFSYPQNPWCPRSQRKEIDDIKHGNEMMRLDAIRGAREARIGTNNAAAQELARLQDQTETYVGRIELEKVSCWRK